MWTIIKCQQFKPLSHTHTHTVLVLLPFLLLYLETSSEALGRDVELFEHKPQWKL
jgi:hypothetical protein